MEQKQGGGKFGMRHCAFRDLEIQHGGFIGLKGFDGNCTRNVLTFVNTTAIA